MCLYQFTFVMNLHHLLWHHATNPTQGVPMNQQIIDDFFGMYKRENALNEN